MPHITKQEQVELETRSVIKMGDACFLFATIAKDMFLASPSWTTIHNIKRALAFPFHNEVTHAMIQKRMGHMDKVDIQVAADLAFLEFYRLIGSRYEDKKRVENGDVFDGIVIEHPIEACGPECFTGQPTLVVPAKRGRGRPKKTVTVNA